MTHRVRGSQDRLGQAPEASGVGEQPRDESGGRLTLHNQVLRKSVEGSF